MALTALQVLTEAAAAEAKTWDATIADNDDDASDLSEREKFQLVTKVNEALEWWWKRQFPKFAWPETVDSDSSVSVTSGLISLSDLGEGSGCALFTSDPRPATSTAQPLQFVISEDGVHPLCTELTTVFAFYRTACPQITYAAASLYATPANIPNVCLRPVVLYANGRRLRSQGQFREGDSQIAAAIDLIDQRRVGLANSGLVWQRNFFAIE